MITLSILLAVVLAPAVILAVKGPGELELMTTPKNFGVIGAELESRPLLLVPTFDTDRLNDQTDVNDAIETHAEILPVGMRVGANA